MLSTIIKQWPFAAAAFAIHTLIEMVLYFGWVSSSADIERDMIWLWMVFVDCPIFFGYIRFVDGASGHLFALTALIVGGAQWALVGALCDLLCRAFPDTSSLRGKPHI